MSTVQEALKRYVEIQEQVATLESEKKKLREVLTAHMVSTGQQIWTPTLENKQLTVRYFPKTTVKYDEALLQQRLGNKYTLILEPDLAKIKLHFAEAAPLLQPLLHQVGTPSREKVKAAVESGAVDRHAFDGAFTKTDSSVFSVGRTSAMK